MFRSLWTDEEGMGTVEYALMLALIAIVVIGAWRALGSRVAITISRTTSSLPAS